MNDGGNEDDTKSSWQDVIILLLGDLRAGNTASQVLLDIVEVDEISEVFHELCTRYLTAKEWTARTNSGLTIKNLCVKYASVLTHLMTRSRSDGELLTLLELDVSAVSDCKDAELLSGDSTVEKLSEGRELYSKMWLKKQRNALRKRLGLEAFTEDAAIATDYMTIEALIQDNDLTDRDPQLIATTDSNVKDHEVDRNVGAMLTNASLGRATAPVAPAVNSYTDLQKDDTAEIEQSTETWFAR